MQPNIGFIGAGNMATALISGMVDRGYPADRIAAFDPVEDQLQRLLGNLNQGLMSAQVRTSTDNAEARFFDILVLAVKPQILPEAARSLAPHLADGCGVVSIAAGVTLAQLEQLLGPRPLVRCMPNTPSLVGLGASGLYANAQVSAELQNQCEAIFRSVGVVNWVESESDLDLVTAVSGSGPAYFFLFMESMIETAIEMGMDPETARALTVQTCRGAGELASHESDIAELRRRVCSPGGTTEQAIASFQQDGLQNLVQRAMNRCAQRAREMAEETARQLEK